MKRAWGFGLGLSATLLATLILLNPATSSSIKKEEGGKSATAELLPVSQVVLFSSGVGFFQREGSVEGDQRVDLSFATDDINDLIKSLTLQDLDGGQVSAVSYESNVPVERTLHSFAIKLNNNPGYGDLLNQAAGEKVEVVLLQAAAGQPATLNGSIVGVEKKQQQSDKGVASTTEFLNLWCADGLRQVKLAEVSRVRFLNAIMESEFRKALETLALGHDAQKKAVSFQFDGKGKRRIKVGYVVENPIWKTSYRLVLDKEHPHDEKIERKGEKKAPYLQGWATVENTTDEDWNAVRMALISGRPISFQMNLYDALFVKRPVVEPDLFASLRPPTYEGAIMQGGKPEENAPAEPKSDSFELRRRQAKDLLSRQSTLRSDKGEDGLAFRERTHQALNERMDLGASVSTAASGAKLGDYFQYAINHPVTLARQKSALLPIVGADVKGDRVSIYNENTHAKFPLLGLAFTNSTGMHLTQGPITVYEGGTYAGDARILDLQKNERRLLSYAIDLGTEVVTQRDADAGQYTSVKAVKGILHTTTKLVEKKTYTVVNRNDVDRVVLLEHPNRTNQGFNLTTKDKPWETASDVYRFEVKVPAGKTEAKSVSEERIVRSEVAISNTDDQFIRFVMQTPVTSPAMKKALEQAVAMRTKLATTQRDIQLSEQQKNILFADQERLRKNLRETPAGSELHERYLKKLGEQETQIENLHKQIKSLQDQELTQRKDYDNFLVNLNVE